MKAGKLDLYIQKGEEFELTLTFTDDSTVPVPLDLTGCSLKATMRKTPSDDDGYDFVCTLVTPASGIAKIVMPFETTSLIELPDEAGQDKKEFLFSWDLYIINLLEKPKRYLEGVVTVTSSNTETV